METKRILAGVFLAAAASTVAAQTVTSTNFDAGAEGWKAANGVTDFTWVPSGGNSGGFVQASDVGGHDLWFFSAPTAYLGNMLSAYGGTLSFDLKSDSSQNPYLPGYADVQLLGGNGVLLAFDGHFNPGVQWTSYLVDLVADGSWKIGSTSGAAATAADMTGVLADLKALRIRGDYKQSVDTTGLDSVVLAAAAVPEPASAALVLAGLAVVARVARRRQRG